MLPELKSCLCILILHSFLREKREMYKALDLFCFVSFQPQKKSYIKDHMLQSKLTISVSRKNDNPDEQCAS